MISFKTKLKFRYALQRINSFVRQRYVFALILIVLVLALAGSITGLSTYVYQYSKSSEGLSECNEKLNTTQFSYAECKDKAASLSSALQTAQVELSNCLNQVTSNLTQCLNDKQKLLTDNKELSDFLADCRVSQANVNITLMTTQLQLDELKKDYNSLVENTANTICCMKNAALQSLNMNVTYSYYYVSNNTIVCTDQYDASLGTKTFSC